MIENMTRKLTGLSSEQMNVFCLKKSVECANNYWNQMFTEGSPERKGKIESKLLISHCTLATSAFLNVIKSAEQQKDAVTLQTLLSENVMISYLRLTLVCCGVEADKDSCDSIVNKELGCEILSVVAHCLKCMDCVDNCDRLVGDFTEGVIYLVSISIKALRSSLDSTADIPIDGSANNIIQFAIMYTNALASMSRKYSNRKKLYTTFCNRLLGPCLRMFEMIKLAALSTFVQKAFSKLFDDFSQVLENLMVNSLFFDDKNVEDLATAITSMPAIAKADSQKAGALFKASYHSGIFDALISLCSGIYTLNEDTGSETYGMFGYSAGIAKLLQVYSKSSNRILATSLSSEANFHANNSVAAPIGKPSSTLQDRRKHTIRILQVSLTLLAIVDNSLQKRFAQFLNDTIIEAKSDSQVGLVNSLVACVHTQKEVLTSLSSALDETGGYSILATHDSLQTLARSLNCLCNKMLVGASSPLLTFVSSALCTKFMKMARKTNVESFVDSLLVEAQSVQFDCVRILAGIDHRTITARADSDNASDPSLVLQGIAGIGDIAANSEDTSRVDQTQILDSKEQLLLSVISLYNDLRRMDDFVSEVRSVCRTGAPSSSTFVMLLGGQRVQDSLARVFAGLPSSQSELVWISLSKCMKKGKSSESSGYKMDQKCQSVVVRALVRATTMSSSTAHRLHDGSSHFDEYSMCDNVLQLGALISLSSPLSPGIVNAMTSLYHESIITLQLLTGNCKELQSSPSDRYDQVGHAFVIISMLLQLGSAAIVLHKSWKSVDDDLWLKFRECAGLTAALDSVQSPVVNEGVLTATVCMPAAIVLLNLSSFLATCDSLKLTVMRQYDLSPVVETESLLVPLSSKMIDAHVLQMIIKSAEHYTPNRCAKSPNVTGIPKKDMRKDSATSKVQIASLSVRAIDFLLLYCRSVSVWCHLAVESSTITTLTLAHFKDMAIYYDDPESCQDRLLLAKHTCFCRLMQLVAVQDCVVLVNGLLLAIDDLLRECSDSISDENSQTSSAKKPKLKTAKAPVNFALLPALSLFARVDNDSTTISVMSLPVDSLLSASAAALGGRLHCSSADVIASIAHHSSSLISQLLIGTATAMSSIAPTTPARKNIAKVLAKPNEDRERTTALDAVSNVLCLCLQNRPVRQGKKPTTSSAQPISDLDPLHTCESTGNSAVSSLVVHSEVDSWSIVYLQLKGILRPLLMSMCTRTELSRCTSFHSLAPLVVDFLLHISFTAENIHDKPHFVLNVMSESILGFLSGSIENTSVLQSCVENYRRVCSFYCALPADIIDSTAALTTVKPVVDTLMSKFLPTLEEGGLASQLNCHHFDACCFLAADSLRLYAKCSEEGTEESSDALLSLNCLPPLPLVGTDVSVSLVLDGWFLLTGTILLLQRRQGNLLSVNGAFLVIDKMKQAILLASSSSSRVGEETLMSLGIALQGLVGIVPHAVRGTVGDMLLDLAQLCACSSSSYDSDASIPSSSGSSISSARLARFVVMGVDCLLSVGGQYNSNFDLAGKETSSSLASARAVLECVAVSCAGRGDIFTRPEVVLAVISGLRRGITTIQQQQQQKGRRRLKRSRTHDQDATEAQEHDKEEAESSRGREHTLSQWASCCFSVLSKIVPRLLKGNGGIKLSCALSDPSDMVRIEISAHALSVLEQLFACDSVGGSSLPLLGNSIGTLGALLTTAVRVIVAADEISIDERTVIRSADILIITNALRVAGRTFTAASSSKELNRHAHILAASLVDLLAQRPLGTSTRELLLPGLFALFDRCKQKQRLQMFATVSAQTRAVLSDLHGTYLRDFKFTGQ